MKILDKRTIDTMPEEERQRYEEEIQMHLTDCSDKCEFVDTKLLMAKIPLRSKHQRPEKSEG